MPLPGAGGETSLCGRFLASLEVLVEVLSRAERDSATLGLVVSVASASFELDFRLALSDEREALARGRILSMVLSETPALRRSETDEYGRLSIIFLAVTAPTPGN